MQENTSVQTFTVTMENKKQRLDAFLAEKADISRVQAKKAIESGLCTVNDGQSDADYKLKVNDRVVYSPLIINNELEAEEGELEILYQDNDYVIINKPPNLTVHPAPSQEKGTLVHLLLSHFPQMREMEGARPGIVHRIDKDTSGILVVALHEKARRELSELFTNREVHKEYLALVHNVPPEENVIDLAIGRHESQKTKMAVRKNGKPALTEYKRLFADVERNYALLAVRIHTGRTHQIRVHLSHTGFPLWGDKSYTARLIKEVPASLAHCALRQMLHAWKIHFIQPLTKQEISITCPIPEDMEQCIARLKEKTQRYVITGNAGCGKSAVLQIFSELGYPTFSADKYVEKLYEKDGAGSFLLRRTFGEEVIPNNKAVDKAILLELVKNADNRKKIEEIIHPLVFKGMIEFFEKSEEAGSTKAFAEIPLFFEKAEKYVESDSNLHVITVYTDEKIRLKRLLTRSWSLERCKEVDSWQLSVEEKKARADTCIENSSTLEELQAQCVNFINAKI